MNWLDALRTHRTLRLIALLGYLMVVAGTLVSPSMPAAAMDSICSAGGNDKAPTLDCALCMPPAAPSPAPPAMNLAHAKAGTWFAANHRSILISRPALAPPARGPPTV